MDVRPVADFAAAHVPGSVSIPLRPVFATWLGWLLPAARPLIVVRNTDQDAAEILWQARKIGYDHLIGQLEGGIREWAQAGQLTGSIPLITAEHVGDASVLTSGRPPSSRLDTSPAPTTSSSATWPTDRRPTISTARPW